MNLAEGFERLDKLRTACDFLMAGVKPGVEPNSWVAVVEISNDAILRSFFGALLIDNPAADTGLVWPLLEAKLPEAMLNHPDIAREKEYLSSPLTGAPVELLMRIKILNEKNAWYDAQRYLQTHATEDQRYVLRLFNESLMR